MIAGTYTKVVGDAGVSVKKQSDFNDWELTVSCRNPLGGDYALKMNLVSKNNNFDGE